MVAILKNISYKLFAVYAAAWFVLHFVVFDNPLLRSIFAGIFFAAGMTVIDMYMERKWGAKLKEEVKRMQSLKPPTPTSSDKKHTK
ncbi:MAG TPA: hypothetical protein VD735_05160 [Candidatus Saccharimonadales bacterium]|nr:hypothetical protein [Candidatus Saccharimonadales bacterium]